MNLVYMKRANPSQQFTVTLFDCNHLAHMIVLWQMRKLMCYCTVFALLYFEFEGNFQEQVLWGLYLEGRFNGVFFALRVGGLIFGGAYFWNITVYVQTPHARERGRIGVQPRSQSFDPCGQRCGSKGSRLRD